jgi:leader peptidase (prepilin peptidase)/N-methyltransferase
VIPAAAPALLGAAGIAGAALGAESPRLARVALAGGRQADGLDARPLDPAPGLGRAAAVVAALVTGILAVVVLVETPPARLPVALLLVVVGPVLVLADLAAHRLPDRATAPAAVAAAALALAAGGSGLLLRAVACGAAAVAVLTLLQAATAGGLAAGTLLGGVAALALLVGGGARASTAVPFGPWLVLGALVVAGAPTTLT